MQHAIFYKNKKNIALSYIPQNTQDFCLVISNVRLNECESQREFPVEIFASDLQQHVHFSVVLCLTQIANCRISYHRVNSDKIIAGSVRDENRAYIFYSLLHRQGFIWAKVDTFPVITSHRNNVTVLTREMNIRLLTHQSSGSENFDSSTGVQNKETSL